MYAAALERPQFPVLIRESGGSGEAFRHSRDAGYGLLLSRKEIVIELLRHFVGEEWVRQLDEHMLTRVGRSFVPAAFYSQEEDWLYRVRLKDAEAFIYLRIVPQSNADGRLPFRLLHAMTGIWQEVVRPDDSEGGGDSFRLPAIVPIVLYNGWRPWMVSLSFRGIVRGQEWFANGQGLLDFEYRMIDVNRCSKRELLQTPGVLAGVFLMEQSRDEQEVFRHLRLLTGSMRQWNEPAFRLFWQWLYTVMDRALPEEEREEIRRLFGQAEPEGVEALISNVERVLKHAMLKRRMQAYAEGMEAGLAEGREAGKAEGLATGRLEGKQEVARNMLQQGMSLEQVRLLTGLPTETLVRLNIR